MVCSPIKLLPKPCLVSAVDKAWRGQAKINLTTCTGAQATERTFSPGKAALVLSLRSSWDSWKDLPSKPFNTKKRCLLSQFFERVLTRGDLWLVGRAVLKQVISLLDPLPSSQWCSRIVAGKLAQSKYSHPVLAYCVSTPQSWAPQQEKQFDEEL